jgi:parvulin-like peptidyl-prolyl isomerase
MLQSSIMKKNKIFLSIKNFFRDKKKKPAAPAIIIVVLVLVILVGGLYYFKNQFISATVNGQPIWRLTLIKELEKESGKATLENLITKALILQEAKKQNLVISQEEIDQKMKELEDNFTSQGQNLDQLLEAQNMTRDQLKEQIEVQLIVEKIVSQDVEVTDEEVAAYFEDNPDYFPEGSDLESVKEDIKQQLKQQKSSDQIQSWLDSLRSNAQINYL